MRKNIPAKIFLFIVLIAIAILTRTVLKYNKSGEYLDQYVLNEFSTPWVYIDKDNNKKDIHLPTRIPSKANTVISIENIIPVKEEFDEFSICFRSKQQFVRVFIEDKEIYSYGYKDTNHFGKSAASAWQMISIKKAYQGKRIRIELQSPYKRYSGLITNIVYCNKYDYQAYILKKYIPGFVVSCVILSLGVFILLVSILWIKYKSEFMTLFYISSCTILMGLWSLGESKVTQFLYSNLDLVLLMTILSLMLVPFPYLLYMKELVEEKNKKFIMALFTVLSINFLRCILLQLTGIRDLIETLNSTLILALICLVVIHIILLYEFIRYKDRKTKLSRASYLSMTGILLIFALIEVWVYYSNVFKEYGLFLKTGILLYMAVMTLTFVGRYMNLITEANNLREELINSQITLMLSQIQPHFLYNTLTAIRALIKKKPDEAYKLVGYFSKYLRTNINSINGNDLIPFMEELNHIKTYVYIELVRFNNQFEVIYDINSEDFMVPPLSIQPIVENAIKHGVCKLAAGGIVTIRTREFKNTIIIEIIDNGIGFNLTEYCNYLEDQEEQDSKRDSKRDKSLEEKDKGRNANGDGKHDSVGLKNIKMRLSKLCNATFKIQSIEGCGTIVSVILPKKK